VEARSIQELVVAHI